MMMKMTAPELGAEGELCGDLIREILLKLPVKSLLRFKQVSKTWMQMITSNSFISKHHSVAKNRCIFIMRNATSHQVGSFISQIYMDSGGIRMHKNIHLSFLERCGEQNTWSLMSPAGFGLYCIFELVTNRVALWNPGTRQLKVVPPGRIHDEQSWMYGFGHVDYKDDRFSYKIGLLSPPHHLGNNGVSYRLQLYSSSSDSWKVLMTPEGSRCCSWMRRGVNLNDKYHILFFDLNKKPEEGNGYKYDYHIMTFDYNNEVFGRMEVPKVPCITGRWNKMFQSFLTLDDDKCLCLVIRWKNAEGGDEDFLDVWVMREYGVKESWSKKGTTGPISYEMEVLGYSEKAGGFFLSGHGHGHGLYFCNCASFAVERLHHVDFDEMQCMQMFESTVGSLVPIKGDSDTT